MSDVVLIRDWAIPGGYSTRDGRFTVSPARSGWAWFLHDTVHSKLSARVPSVRYARDEIARVLAEEATTQGERS